MTAEAATATDKREFWDACPLAKWIVDQKVKCDLTDSKLGKMTLENVSDTEDQPYKWQVDTLPLPLTTDPTSFAEVGKLVERTFIGLVEPFQGKVFGLLNFPARLTRSIPPENMSRNPRGVLTDLARQLQNARFFGPYTVVVGDKLKWVGEASKSVEGYADWCLSPQMPDDRFAVVQITPDVIRAVVGMRPKRFDGKAAAIVVPQLRADYYGNAGVVEIVLS